MKTLFEILNKDFVMEHIFIGLQKCSKGNVVKRDSGFDGIESYLLIKWEEEDHYCCVKIIDKFLNQLNISVNEAWEQAECNTNKETVIATMDQILNEISGTKDYVDSIPLFVVTNKSNNRGASAILNRAALSEFGHQHNIKKVIVMPSSIHEMIMCPYDNDDNIEDYINLVKTVNENEVLPEEQLANQAYVIEI